MRARECVPSSGHGDWNFLEAEAAIQAALGNQVEVRRLYTRLLAMARAAKNRGAEINAQYGLSLGQHELAGC